MSEFRVGQWVKDVETSGRLARIKEISADGTRIIAGVQGAGDWSFAPDELEPADPPASGDEAFDNVRTRLMGFDALPAQFRSPLEQAFADDARRLLDALDTVTKGRDAAVAALRQIAEQPINAIYEKDGEPGIVLDPMDDWSHGHLDGLRSAAKIAAKALSIRETADDHE